MRAPGFTGGRIDRSDPVRLDDALLAEAKRDPRARLLRLEGREPAVREGALDWAPLGQAGDSPPIFLGFDETGIPSFAPVPAVDAASPATGGGRPFGLPADQAALFATARSLISWHLRHRFCANCGSETAMVRAGWCRKCLNCAAEHYPRVDPVVIMLAEHDGRALLGRQPSWGAGRYSALAGFLEVGESIEEAVAREIAEEAGVKVRDVRYVASQPWPYPSSLMIGCVATAEDDALSIDTNELEDARWFSHAEVRAALDEAPDAPFIAPPSVAIARSLLEWWVEQR